MIRKGFQTSDGIFFTDEKEAERHENKPDTRYPQVPNCGYNGCRGCPECIAYAEHPLNPFKHR